ncbi:terminase small subunit [Acetobacteraceae bacterium AT-5844]|nr:terminase small subunit [Acetobacteraceae bacterium AT-5844]
MSLTEKQRRFVKAYLIEPNGKKAAIAAGYSPKGAEVQASRMLSQAKVQQALAEARKAVSIEAGITPAMVIAELAKIGFSDIRKVVKWMSDVQKMAFDPDTGEPVLEITNRIVLEDSEGLDEATAGSIAEVSMTKSGTLKVKLYDKRGALNDLAQILGMKTALRAPKAPGVPSPDPQPSPAAPDAPEGGDNGWGQLLN